MVDSNKILNSDYYIRFIKYFLEKDHVLYNVEIVCKNDASYSVTYNDRYSNLEKFHQIFKKAAKSHNYPTFPEKKYFGNTEPKFLSQRLSSLQNYFENILSHKEFSKLKSVKDWIYDLFIKYYKPQTVVDQNQNNSSKNNKGNGNIENNNNVSFNNNNKNNKLNDNNKNQKNNGNDTNNNQKNNEINDYQKREQKKEEDKKEMMKKCSEIVDKFTRQFIDLHEEVIQPIQDEEEKLKEKKYHQIILSSKIESNLFKIPKGCDENFELLGNQNNNGEMEKCYKNLDGKIQKMADLMKSQISEDLKIDNIISSL